MGALRALATAGGLALLALAAFFGFVAFQLAWTGAPVPGEIVLGIVAFGTALLVAAAAGFGLLAAGRART